MLSLSLGAWDVRKGLCQRDQAFDVTTARVTIRAWHPTIKMILCQTCYRGRLDKCIVILFHNRYI